VKFKWFWRRQRWVYKMLNEWGPHWDGLKLAKMVGLNPRGVRMQQRAVKHICWIERVNKHLPAFTPSGKGQST